MKRGILSLCFGLVLLNLSVQPTVAQETDSTVYWGLFDEQVQNNVSLIDNYTAMVGKKPAIIMWYTGWYATGDYSFPKAQCTALWNAGYLPDVTWEPWLGVDAILSGNYDDKLIQYGKDVAEYGNPVMLRWGHEFNGNWYPWSIDASGQLVPASKWVEAYKHVHDLVVDAGGTNAIWIWCPNNSTSSSNGQSLTDYYPGDDYVDWLSIDGYNWGTTESWSSWTLFDGVFNSMYQSLVTSFPGKPIIIGEYGCTSTGGDKAAWITDHFKKIKNNFPQIKAFVWFNVNKETDWRFTSTTESTTAFKEGLADPVFSGDYKGVANYLFNTVEIEQSGSVAPGQSKVVFRLSSVNSGWKYEWSVTGNASVEGVNNLDSVLINSGCVGDTVFCKLITKTDTVELHKMVLMTDGYTIDAPMFVDKNEAGVVLSTAYSSDAVYSWTVPSEVSLAGNSDSCRLNVTWSNRTDTVKLQVQNGCGTYSAQSVLYITGEYAYPDPAQPHLLPGTIEPVEYDYGGEGVAYHDADSGNQGTASRSDEGVDTETNSDNGEDIGWISAGEWVNYTIKVTDPGTYFVEARVASQSGGGKLSILLDKEVSISNSVIGSTGSWTKFASVYLGYVDLNSSDTLLTYSFVSSGFNMGKMVFWPLDTIKPTTPGNLTATSTATSITLRWGHSVDNQKLLAYNVYINGGLYKQVTDTLCKITKLNVGTAYPVAVSAIDIQGNLSDAREGSFSTLTTGIDDVQTRNSIVYPNPLTKGETLKIKIGEDFVSGQASVRIFDLYGRKVYQALVTGKEFTVSSDNFSVGVYTLQFLNGKNTLTDLFVVK